MTRQPLLTVRDAAAHLSVSVSTVRRLARSGALPIVVVGDRSTRIRQSDVDRYIAERTQRRIATPGRIEAVGLALAPGERLWD